MIGRFRTSLRRLARGRAIAYQHETADCGPAALLTVLRMHGRDCALETIRDHAGTDASGTSVYGMTRAAAAIGFKASAVRGTFADLQACTPPFIAHVTTDDGLLHFLVVRKITRRHVLVADPALGRRRLGIDRFQAMWRSGVAILLEDLGAQAPSVAPSVKAWLIGHLADNSVWLTQSAFLGAIYAALGVASAFFLQVVINRSIPLHDSAGLMRVALAFIALGGLRGLIGWLRQRFSAMLFRQSGSGLARSFLERIFFAHTRYFDSRRVGDIASRLNDLMTINGTLVANVGGMVIDLLMVLVSVVALAMLSVQVALISLASFVALFAACLGFFRVIGRLQRLGAASFARTQASFLDGIKGALEVKALSLERHRARHTVERIDEYLGHAHAVRKRAGDLGLLTDLANSLLLGYVLFHGAQSAIEGDGKPGALFAMYAILGYSAPSVLRLAQSLISCQQAWISASRLVEALGAKAEEPDGGLEPDGFRSLALADARIEHPDGRVLMKVPAFRVARGELIRLHGGNGGGKTTLGKVLQLTWPCSRGAYRINGIAAEELAPRWVRRHVVLVTKQAHLFSASVFDNLLANIEESERPQSLARLERWGCLNLLAGLGLALGEQLGEGGRTLSSGEQQVVALARALAGAPAVLILDEALSALDQHHRALAMTVVSHFRLEGAVILIEHGQGEPETFDRVYHLQRASGFSELVEPAPDESARDGLPGVSLMGVQA